MVGDGERLEMSPPFHVLGSPDSDILIVADHASNHVPDDVDLGIDRMLLQDHIALDIGVTEVAAALVDGGGCCAILGGVSRLVIDYNREPDAPGLVPTSSDGIAIPGNIGADVAGRVRRYHAPYHHRVSELAGMAHQPFILSLHSFTPNLRTAPQTLRPWEIGVLYNEDKRAAPIAIERLSGFGRMVGDQQPYSGRDLNYTMNRHAEAHDRPYLGVELRQNLIGDAASQRVFAAELRATVDHVRKVLHDRGP